MNAHIPGVSCWDFSGVYRQMELPVPREEVQFHDMRDLSGTNCYCDDAAAEQIRTAMRSERTAGIHFTDTGNYHYMSYLYLSLLQKKTLLVVFDHHTDMQEPAFGGILSCGGWVKRTVSDLQHVVDAWVIGPEEKDIEAASDAAEEQAFFLSGEKLMDFRSEGAFEKRIRTLFRERMEKSMKSVERPEQIYISVDKDILSPEFASCPWSQGDVTLDELSFMITSVLTEAQKAGLRPAAADICGESVPDDPEGILKSSIADQRLYDLLKRSF